MVGIFDDFLDGFVRMLTRASFSWSSCGIFKTTLNLKLTFSCNLMTQGMVNLIMSHLYPGAEFIS